MARRPEAPPNQPGLTLPQKRRALLRLKDCIRELEEFDPRKLQKRYQDPLQLAMEASIRDALTNAFGHGTEVFKSYERATHLDTGSYQAQVGDVFGRRDPTDYDARDRADAARYAQEGKERALALLAQASKKLANDIADLEIDDPTLPAPAMSVHATGNRSVFIVHGHDVGIRETVARYLQQIGLRPIILHEQADQGRTIIEKFEDHAGEARFAIVLLTPDDLGGPVSQIEQQHRARQNVILELGYFIGKLGRKNTLLMKKGNVEFPSDVYGVIYTSVDDGGWKMKLVQELDAAGLEVDHRQAFR